MIFLIKNKHIGINNCIFMNNSPQNIINSLDNSMFLAIFNDNITIDGLTLKNNPFKSSFYFF